MSLTYFPNANGRYPSTDPALPYRLDNLNAILNFVENGRCVFVVGPRHRAKSNLMKAAMEQLEQQNVTAAYFSLTNILATSANDFYSSLSSDMLLVEEQDFYQGLYEGLESDMLDLLSPKHRIPPNSLPTFRDAIVTLATAAQNDLVLFIDDLEGVPPNLIDGMLSAFRQAYTTIQKRFGAKLRVVICGLRHVTKPTIAAKRFLEIAPTVWVDDLDLKGGQALVKQLCYDIGIRPTPEGINALLDSAGGNYFLIQELCKISFEQMRLESKQVLTIARVDEAVNTFLNQPHETLKNDILRPIEGNAELLGYTLSILRQGRLPIQDLPEKFKAPHNELDMCGVFERVEDAYQIKGTIWKHWLTRQFTPTVVGRLQAVAGDWEAAIAAFGEAICDGEESIRTELFSVIINAMHECPNHHKAFAYLGKGLRAMFPENDVCLYFRSGRHLRQIFPRPQAKAGTFKLSQTDQPEVAALDGPDYSVASPNGESRLLIPMHLRDKAMGLASFNNLAAVHSPYKTRQLLLRLVNFLQKATIVVGQRRDYANMLRAKEMRVTQLDALNNALTTMLPHHHQSDEMIIEITLREITDSFGLGLDRALLLMPDDTAKSLVGVAGMQKQRVDNHPYSGQRPPTMLLQQARRIAVPLRGPQARHLFADVFHSRRPARSTKKQPLATLPTIFRDKLNASPEFAVLPLNTGADEPLGILFVDNRRRKINDEQYQLLQSFANQVALVLANARAFRAERTRSRQLQILAKLEEQINGRISESVPALLTEVVQAASHLLKADSAILYPIDPSESRIDEFNAVVHGLEAQQAIAASLMAPKAITQRILQSQTIRIEDVQKEISATVRPQTLGNSFLTHQPVGAFLGTRLGDAEAPLGVLYINWQKPRRLTNDELMLVDMLAKFASVAIPSAQRYQQVQLDLKRRQMEMAELGKLFRAVYESEQYERQIGVAIRESLRIAQRVVAATYICVIRSEPQRQWRTYTLAPSGRLNSEAQTERPFGLPYTVFETQEALLVTNTNQHHIHTYLPQTQAALAIPIKGQNQFQAVLYVESPEPNGLTTEHQEFLQSIANRLSMAMEQDERNQALYQLLQSVLNVTQATDLQTMLRRLVYQTLAAMPAVDAVALYYFDQDSGELMLSYISSGQDEATIAQSEFPSTKFVGWLLSLEKAHFIEKSPLSPMVQQAFPQQDGVQAAAAIPLLRGGQEWTGCMFFGYQQPPQFAESDKNLMELFAQLAALAILRVTLYEEAESRRQRLETVGRITPIISSNFELQKVVHTVLDEVIKVLPRADHGCILLLREDEQLTHMAGRDNMFYPFDYQTAVFRDRQIDGARRGIIERVLRSKRSVIISDVTQDMDYIPVIDTTRSKLCVPIADQGDIVAVLVLESNQTDAFSSDDQRLLEMLANYITIAIQNVERINQARALELSHRTAQMAAGFMHDINTAISNIPDLVKEIGSLVEQERPFTEPLTDLYTNAQATDRISKRLHDFVVTKEYRPTQVELLEVIETAIQGGRLQEPEHVETRFKSSVTSLPMVLDGVWIELMLKNLLLNAYAAIPTERNGRVTVTLQEKENAVIISVADNGRGIHESLRESLFEFGVTSKESSRLNGIGLYHCQQIVRTHGGTLDYKTCTGEGTTFTVELPRT